MELQIEGIIGVVAILLFVYLIIQRRNTPSSEPKPKEVQELNSLKIKVHRERKQTGSIYLNIQCKGLIPVSTKTNIGFSVSVVTKGKNGVNKPVLSMIDSYQEPESRVFQDLRQIGEVDKYQGLGDWTTVGVVPTEILQPAMSGNQNLNIIVMLADMDNFPEIILGSGKGGILTFVEECNHYFSVKGYHEEGDNIDNARALSVKIGVAIGMSDGDFNETERKTLDTWIKRMIMPFDREKQIALKDLYNMAKNDAEEVFSGLNLYQQPWVDELNAICKKLCNIGEEAQKYETLELAHEIMVADGIERDEESKSIHKIARNLGINAEEIESIRSSKIHKLDNVVS